MKAAKKIPINKIILGGLSLAALGFLIYWGNSDVSKIRDPKDLRFGGVFGSKEVYAINQSPNLAGPKFFEVGIDPRKVSLRDIQHLSVEMEKPEEVESVVATTELDSSAKTIELSRGSDNVWRGEWRVEDTSTRTYHTTFVARGKDGKENSFTMAWSDPCSGVPLNPAGGTASLGASCSISGVDGIDNGSLNLNGYTLTLNSGATFAWNSGYSITVNGTIAVAGGAQIKQTYLWAQDVDNDGWSSGALAAQDSQPVSYRRLYTASSLSDCNDGNASLTDLKTGYVDNDGDGRAGTYVSSACVASVTGSSSDCNDANGSVWNNGYGYDGDRDGYGTSGYGCNNGNNPYDATAGTDCNDASVSYYVNRTCYQDSDADGYTTGGGVSSCSGSSCVSPWHGYRDSPNGSDCNDSNASLWQYLTGYGDGDYDGYGAGTSYQICSGSSLPSGWSSNNLDCYNTNANAHPGQTAWFTTNRGDGSFDYNCSGALDFQYGTTIASVATDKNGFCVSNTIGWSSCVPTCGNSGTYYYNTTCGAASYAQGCH